LWSCDLFLWGALSLKHYDKPGFGIYLKIVVFRDVTWFVEHYIGLIIFEQENKISEQIIKWNVLKICLAELCVLSLNK
jgi:hypothetical protein